MQRNYLHLLSLFVLGWLLVSCEQADIQPTTLDATQVQALPKSEINAFIQTELEKGEVFRWEKGSPELVWSAMSYGNHHAVIGYQPAGFRNIKERIHEIDITQREWRQVRQELIDMVVDLSAHYVPGEKLTAADLILSPLETVLPSFEIKILHPEIVNALRERAEVRYVEPMNYSMEEVNNRSDSGCGIQAASNIPTADYTTIAPGAKVPWNFHLLNIPSAWNTSNGDNVKVAVIDTGTSPNQPKLGSQFSSGYSSSRSLSRFGTYVSSWWWWADPDGPDDDCGHGTQMSGLIAAPRTSSGSTTGVAWKADLASYRATGDVVINSSSEKNGVRDALVMAGDDNQTKIISMSIGDVLWSSTVADGVYYAYNRGKLIFAAAGTSLTWTSWWGVIFPASMSETVAVTGVKEGYPLVRCSSCHDGSAVDFIVPMQRRNDNSRTSLTLAMSGNTPSYVGGSSAATATTAGVAALVWATNRSQSRAQVLNRLKQAASIYPGRDGNFGWGIIDAAYAVTH